MKIHQTNIAHKAGVSPCFISMCLSGKKRPSWRTAKKIALATQTDPVVWLEGSPDEIRSAILGNNITLGYKNGQKNGKIPV